MEIEAIGGVVGSANSETVNSIDLEGFLELFITQLTYQDPLEPTKNEDFLAQMAQFAALDQQRQANEGISGLTSISSTSQSVDMIGRSVEVSTDTVNISGTVTAIRYSDSGALLTIEDSDGAITPNVRLSQITLIQDTE